MKELHVLVTGGAGFIGSHLCDRLVAEGHQVICLDNFFTGRKRNISHLLSRSNFELIRHDVTVPFSHEVDQIYHLACPASPVHYQFNPIKTVETCVFGTIHALHVAEACGASLLLASTSEVYGDPDIHPQKESYRGNVNTTGPRACYDEGKRVGETLVSDYRRQNRVDTKIARIFNTYGPNMAPNDGRVISNFIVQALRSEPLTVYGDGQQTRSFCFVSDLVQGLISLMNAGPEVSGPVNLGNPAEQTIRSVANKVIDSCNTDSRIVKKPLPEDDPTRRCPDISLAMAQLGWEPRVDFQEGLAKTIEYFRGLVTGSED
jgi:UDP-glucuronate decarboxylase